LSSDSVSLHFLLNRSQSGCISPLNSASSSVCFGTILSGVFLALLALIYPALLLALKVVLLQLLTLNCSYPCLHLLKTVFRQPSREHLVEGLGLSIVTKTTPPLCSKRLSMYALARQRVCHPDSDTGNLVTKPLSSNGRPLSFRYPGFQTARHIILDINVKNQIYNSRSGCKK
jgi:hypothetical protein